MRGDFPRRSARRKVAALGIALLVVGQVLTVWHLRPWSDYWYGIVWTGFVLVADVVVDVRDGGSLVLDRPRELAVMFVASAILWWGFEGLNAVLLGSWTYGASNDVSRGVQAVRSTYFFGTLVPATFQASALTISFTRVRPRAPEPSRRGAYAAIAIGVAFGLLAIRVRPLALPFALIALGLVVDGTNLLRSRPSLIALLAGHAYGLVAAVMLGNVFAGVLGEMWNWTAAPRWTYDAPYAGSVHLFAMPIPGYLGYAALALDLFALYHFVRPRVRGRNLPKDHPFSQLGVG